MNKPEEKLRANQARFYRTTERIQILAELSPPNKLASLATIRDQLQEVRRALKADLDENKFMALSRLEVEKYKHENLFGLEVFTNFPSTRDDVAEAGNCYATERYTACVFHCMRVIEKGLHAFVRDLNTRCNAAVKFNKEIEYVNWGNIIDKIESELKALLKPDAKSRLDPDVARFYSETAKEFVYIKYAWRDDVSHSRASYDEPTARSVMDHVQAFMIYLSEQGLNEE